MKRKIRCKRVYQDVAPTEGMRILVERLWPRGISKAEAAIDIWLKEIAPSSELRKWFAHVPARWPEFKTRYRKELSVNPDPVNELLELAKRHDLTLVYSARDEPGNSAQVLQEYLQEQRGKTTGHA